jgi:hypothetical protein
MGVSAACFVVIPLLVLPLDAVRATLDTLWTTPAVMESSARYMFSLMVLSALMGSGLVALGQVYRNKRHERALKVVRARRGTVITETLITLPPFFLLLFGLSQQSINSIAQILANVAVHRAAHSVWVWEPETRGGSVQPKDRACLAVAGVMAPVAPGDFPSFPRSSSNEMKSYRAALVMSQIPLGGSLAGTANSLISLADLVPSSVVPGGGGQESTFSISRALDESSFLVRSAYKFTAAYRACTVNIANATVASTGGASVPGYDVSIEYKHSQVMPLVGAVFAGTSLGGVLLGDHFITIKRTLPWPKQVIKINTRLPNNGGPGGSGGGGVGAGDIRGRL